VKQRHLAVGLPRQALPQVQKFELHGLSVPLTQSLKMYTRLDSSTANLLLSQKGATTNKLILIKNQCIYYPSNYVAHLTRTFKSFRLDQEMFKTVMFFKANGALSCKQKDSLRAFLFSVKINVIIYSISDS